jgi:phosphopantetheinyl transferase
VVRKERHDLCGVITFDNLVYCAVPEWRVHWSIFSKPPVEPRKCWGFAISHKSLNVVSIVISDDQVGVFTINP